ncbi:hypothetical protein ACFPIF_01815 [Brevundimonas faecalis]|uniref:hypothetical protein n=1 Tax=Brevundimonas faecalis TaxID=947378 RepID=UPI00361C0DB2
MADYGLTDLTQDRVMLRTLYAPPEGAFGVVDVPALPFAVLDGAGAPEQASIGAAVRALYTAIYPIRREARERMGKAFVEAPVEILYQADDLDDVAAGRRDKWKWRVQITLPVWVDAGRLEDSVAEMRSELGDATAPRWEAVVEGACVQRLHLGQVDDLPDLLRDLYLDYLPREALEPAGAYHEIYLDDWSRVAPARRRIIVRQPVQRIA